MPKFFLGGEIHRPVQLRTLPLQLYRSQNYPAQPTFMGDEAKRYLDGTPPPIYVPARMMYTRWSRVKDAFGANTVAMLEALKQSRELTERMQAEALGQAGGGQIPVMDYTASADALGATNLPTLRRLSQQDYNRVPLARNALPLSKFLDPDTLVNAVRTQQPMT
jgi:hypothetical protein